MRIDSPQCGFRNCKKCFDGNCRSIDDYRKCEFAVDRSMLRAYQEESIKRNTQIIGLYIITKRGDATYVSGYLSDAELEAVNSIAKSFKGNSDEFISIINSSLGTSLESVPVREVFRIQ